MDPRNPNIPIIGDPYKIHHWHGTIVIECGKCDAREIIVLIGSTPQKCPNCKWIFHAALVDWDLRRSANGNIGVMCAPPAIEGKQD